MGKVWRVSCCLFWKRNEEEEEEMLTKEQIQLAVNIANEDADEGVQSKLRSQLYWPEKLEHFNDKLRQVKQDKEGTERSWNYDSNELLLFCIGW